MTALPVVPALVVVVLLLLDFWRIIRRSRITPFQVQVARMKAQFDAMAVVFGQQLTPSLKRACEGLAAFGRALAAARVADGE